MFVPEHRKPPSRDRLPWETQKQSLMDCFKSSLFPPILLPSPSLAFSLPLSFSSLPALNDYKIQIISLHKSDSYLSMDFKADRPFATADCTACIHVFGEIINSLAVQKNKDQAQEML